ncbi:MAG TPA: ABC transporter permease, partial [Vicinamibacterales bacterium]|nr:ABC transporter permease [Vicinamibacterales bacterium]
MDRLLQDLRFGVRLLLRDRAFSITTLLTLAVCIGANAAIFAVVNAVLLRPLPLREPENLVLVHNSYPRAGVERASNGVPDYYDRLRDVAAFDELALYNTRGMTIGMNGSPQRVTGMIARPSLLRLLHVQPYRGRIFAEGDGEPGRARQAILTYELWQQLYAGSESALGSELRVNGEPHTIVGVLPRDFTFVNRDVKLWVPLAFTTEERSDDARHSNNWSMIGRLKPGATVLQAQQQLDALNARNLQRFPQFKEILTNAGFRTVALSFQEDMVREVRGTLFLLWGGVLFVLLIGVVNITNLVLVRSSARMRELATRHALGAGMARLGRQILTETVMITIAGAAAGLALGSWGLTFLTTLGIAEMPRGSEVRMDTAVVLFTGALALLVAVLVSAAPIVALRHMNLSQAFREEGRSGTSGRSARMVRRALVSSQVAFAFMLLAGAGLLFTSFQRVLAIDPGFNPQGVMTGRVAPPAARYADDAQLRAFVSRFLERVRTLPGVTAAGVTSGIPFGGDYSDSVILAEGYQMAPGESLISPYQVSVSSGYFEAMGIAPVEGRLFADSDTDTAAKVIIVDQKLARRFWGTTSPIGRRMYKPDSAEHVLKPGPDAQWFTVVGVVPEVRISGYVASDDRVGAYYFPYAQAPRRTFALTVKTPGDPTSITPLVRRELGARGLRVRAPRGGRREDRREQQDGGEATRHRRHARTPNGGRPRARPRSTRACGRRSRRAPRARRRGRSAARRCPTSGARTSAPPRSARPS